MTVIDNLTALRLVRDSTESAAKADAHSRRGATAQLLDDLARATFCPSNKADQEAHQLSVAATLMFVRGDQPVHYNGSIRRLGRECKAVPTDGQVVRELTTDSSVHQLIVASEWTAYVARYNGDTWLSISATTQSGIDAVIIEMKSWAKPTAVKGRVGITFTYLAGGCPSRSWRSIEGNSWESARANYPKAARAGLDRLVATTPESKPAGRIVLLHGPPGTGKSSLVRSLAESWASWCDIEVIVDPEQLFAHSAYLFGTVLDDTTDDDSNDDDHDDADHDDDGHDDHDHDGHDDNKVDDSGLNLAPDGQPMRTKRWRMFVLEDCGELLREDAKERNGQAMARLLNVADGILGQGLRVLFCLTTNEDLRALHGALVRPGRCFGQFSIGRFGADEADAWLEVHGLAERGRSESRSLAELVAIRDGLEMATSSSPAIGLYL